MPPTANTDSATLTRADALELYRRLGIPPIGGGDGTDEKPTGDPPNTESKEEKEEYPEGLGDTGKAALKAERDARKAAEKARTEADKELIALRKAKADADAAKAAADEADAAKRGEFESLANKRKEEADAARADADAKGKNLERANSVISAVLKERIAELEALKDEELSAEFAAITEPLDQIDWFNKASTKRAMVNATEDKKVEEAKKKPQLPKTPKPNGDGKPEIKSLVNARTF